MSPDFVAFLRAPSAALAAEPADPPPHCRLWRAYRQDRLGEQALGPADLVCLLRAVQRSETVRRPQFALPLEVADAWLGRVQDDLLQRAGLYPRGRGTTGPRLEAAPWRPVWLGPAVGNPALDEALHLDECLHHEEPAAADPMLDRVGFTSYQSEAQRQAVRAVCCAPPGATVVVDLPTGSGKSLCALLPALLPFRDALDLLGTTPIVVPTVALALDLQERLRAVLPHATAYRYDEAEAAAVRARVAAGTQGPVFTSPESLAGSLREPLRAAARAGRLRLFVVDEAHMISAWGDEFRPAFQQIAALRKELLQLSPRPFVTLLASATLTEYHLQTLRELFGSPGPFRVTHAVRLRPEPAYWMARAEGEGQRRAWLLEALFHLPRPLILYTTRRDHCRDWFDLLRDTGFRRVGLMHGGTGAAERRRLLEAWRGDRLDVMVATSAFGLGVDKQDVRAVLHAALPEGVDRFYQDVGRGGRDGRASLSLLVYAAEDWGTARGLMVPTFIGPDRGRSRWQAMFESPDRRSLGDHTYAVPLTSVPSWLEGPSDENERWNVRTLLLMARSGLLELTAPPASPAVAAGAPADDEADTERLPVRLLRGDHLSEEVWDVEIEDRRRQFLGAGQRSFELLSRLLSGKECVARVLRDCYRSDDPAVSVVLACGGCPWCRARGHHCPTGPLRARHVPAEPWPGLPPGAELARLLDGRRLALVYYQPQTTDTIPTAELGELAGWLLEQGAVNLAAGPRLLGELRPWFADRPDRVVFLHRAVPGGADVTAGQGTAVFVGEPDGPDWAAVWAALQNPVASWTVLVLPEDARQPDHDGRRLWDTWTEPPSLTLAAWQQEYRL